ncbi:MAG TPA: DoxX family protein [Gammaproteobacteria bacterium]|jgi:putative oxidoreductase|nr:DoxX family protein [Gammaproteobacteria bacterium]
MHKFILDKWSPQILSLLRIVTAFLFIWHGTSKFFHYPMDMGQMSLFSLMGLAGVLEIVGSVLLILGLFTKPAAFVLSGEMAVAYFMAHAPMGFLPLVNHGEDAVLFCFVFLYLAAAGGGPISLDAVMRKK